MILSGKLEIGAKLPPERELAESMQVSRAVVNSGLDEMEKKGFLVVKPRIGTFVADYRKYGTADTLVSIMQYNGGMLRDKEVRSILEVRIMFMILAATLAIDNADDASIAGLEQYVTALKACEDPEEAASLIFDFSHELSFIGGNSLLRCFRLLQGSGDKPVGASPASTAQRRSLRARSRFSFMCGIATKTPPSAISRTPPTKVLTAAARSIRRHRFRSE